MPSLRVLNASNKIIYVRVRARARAYVCALMNAAQKIGPKKYFQKKCKNVW